MPLPAQATVYDQGIPIAVDPRIRPGLTPSTHRPQVQTPSPPVPSVPIPKPIDQNTPITTSTTKRHASDAPRDDLNKRVKSGHVPSVLESPIQQSPHHLQLQFRQPISSIHDLLPGTLWRDPRALEAAILLTTWQVIGNLTPRSAQLGLSKLSIHYKKLG
jgi:hypothetical protein